MKKNYFFYYTVFNYLFSLVHKESVKNRFILIQKYITGKICQNIIKFQIDWRKKAAGWKKEIEDRSRKIEQKKEALNSERILLTDEMIDEIEEEITLDEEELSEYQQKRFGPRGDLIIQKNNN